jgi:hypothetical protein
MKCTPADVVLQLLPLALQLTYLTAKLLLKVENR